MRFLLVSAALLIAMGVADMSAQRRGGRAGPPPDGDAGARGGRGRGAATVVRIPDGAVVRRALSYVEGGDRQQVLDLYLPRAPRPAPLVVAVHGGGWRADGSGNAHLGWGIPVLLRAGFAVASVDHRPSTRARFPAQIHDVKAAVRWLRANAAGYGYDAQRIGAWGMSSGGHLVALLGTSADVPEMEGALGPDAESSRVHAVIDWFGPTDFLQMDAYRLPDGLIHNRPGSPESQLVGGPIQTMVSAVRAANPISYVSADDPPFLIFHGDRDRMVPHHQSQLLHEALVTAGVPSQLQILTGAGHGSREFRTDRVARQMVEFFQRHIRPARG